MSYIVMDGGMADAATVVPRPLVELISDATSAVAIAPKLTEAVKPIQKAEISDEKDTVKSVRPMALRFTLINTLKKQPT